MLEKNQSYDVEFVDMTHDAMGVCKIDNFPIFVAGALKGERAKIKIVKVNKSFGFGRLEEIYSESPFRKKPICEHYAECGACNLMHMGYQMQLDFKRYRTKVTLERLGKVETVVNDTVGMANPYYYRNKVVIPFSEKNGEMIAGLYKSRTHEIFDMKRCYIMPKVSGDIVRLLKNIFVELKIPAYNEETLSGCIRHVQIRTSYNFNDISVTIVTNTKKLPHSDIIVSKLIEKYPRIKSIVQNINTKKTNVILGENSNVLFGEDKIRDTINKIHFEISHKSFYQINPAQTQYLYAKAIDYAGLEGKETILDAYCGIGTIGLCAAKKVGKVIGIEVVKAAIENANRNVEKNGILNAVFVQGKAEEVLEKFPHEHIDVVFIDPPRKGCDKEFLQALMHMKAKTIIYISCNVSTLARDLNYIQGHNYKVLEVTPFDMFPQTTHIEAVCKIVRT